MSLSAKTFLFLGVLLAAEPLAASLPVPSVYVVNSPLDDNDDNLDDNICHTAEGECTFRAALNQSNKHPGPDVIRFEIPWEGDHTISPGSFLPAFTEPVTVDATTEEDYAGVPRIRLDGIGAGNVTGLTFSGGGSTVKGLAIVRYRGPAVILDSGGNTIQSCYLGVDTDGTTALGNNEGLNLGAGGNNTVGGPPPSRATSFRATGPSGS